MALVNNKPYNDRQFQDGQYIQTGSMATASAALDLQQAVAYSVTEYVNVFASISCSAASFANSTSSAAFQDSADNVTFTNVASRANPILTQFFTGSNNITFKLDPNSQRYIRLSGSFNTASITSTYALSLKF